MESLIDYQKEIYLTRTDPDNYEAYYANEQCYKENREIQKILLSELKPGGSILDLGSGLGLGYELLGRPPNYIGLDISARMVQKCHSRYNGVFLLGDAEEYVSCANYLDNVIALFSFNYMRPSLVDVIMSKLRGTFIMVRYNEPYRKNSGSAYRGLRELFDYWHGGSSKELDSRLAAHSAKTFKLLGEDYFYVSVLRGR